MESNNASSRGALGQPERPLATYNRDRPALLQLAFEGLHVPPETANRVARWLENYTTEPDHSVEGAAAILGTPEDDEHDELVIVKDIAFTALCLHHLLPFHGRAAVGYIPNGGKLVGLSKLARLVDYYTQWPTLQEHITDHVADGLEANVPCMGVMVVLSNVEHACMSLRGVKKEHATTTTSAVRGVFRDDPAARNEFLALMR